jgi:hypothetical protein
VALAGLLVPVLQLESALVFVTGLAQVLSMVLGLEQMLSMVLGLEQVLDSHPRTVQTGAVPAYRTHNCTCIHTYIRTQERAGHRHHQQ